MSRMIPNNSTPLTVMQLLYCFSHLCALNPGPHPEKNNEGIPIHLKTAEKDTSKAPKIPNPDNILSRRTIPPPQNNNNPSPSPRRSPCRHTIIQNSPVKQLPSLSLNINSYTKGAYLGCKGWRGTLNNGQIVFAKPWDAWKFSSTDCDHEASVYFHLRDLWGSVVPEFICNGDWGFCHILVLSYIEVSPLSSSFLIISVQCYIKLDLIQLLLKTLSMRLEKFMRERCIMEIFEWRIFLSDLIILLSLLILKGVF
jgi:hypothetical protein